jgi:hypothetical protein
MKKVCKVQMAASTAAASNSLMGGMPAAISSTVMQFFVMQWFNSSMFIGYLHVGKESTIDVITCSPLARTRIVNASAVTGLPRPIASDCT